MFLSKDELSPKRQKVRARIVESAMEVFSTYGYHDSTITAIAKKAKIAEGTIYLYFFNKDHLIIEVAEEFLSEMFERVKQKTADIVNPLEKIFAFIDANVQEFLNNPGVSKVLVLEFQKVRVNPLEDSGFTSNAYRNYISYLTEISDVAITQGFIRKMPPEDIAHIIFGCIDYSLRIWALSGFEPNVQKMVARMKNIITYGIVK